MIEIRTVKTREPMQAVTYSGAMSEVGNIAEFLTAVSFTADCNSGRVSMRLDFGSTIEFSPGDIITRTMYGIMVMSEKAFNERYEVN